MEETSVICTILPNLCYKLLKTHRYPRKINTFRRIVVPFRRVKKGATTIGLSIFAPL